MPGERKTGRALLVGKPPMQRQGRVKVKWALPMPKGVAWLGVPFWGRERGWMGCSSLLTPDALLSGWY